VRPDVRAKHCPGNAPAGLTLDLQRPIRGKPGLASPRLHHHGEGAARQAGELGGGQAVQIDGWVSHAPRIWNKGPYQSTPNGACGQIDPGIHNSGMDTHWPQRSRFRELVDAYKKRTNITNDQLAPLLGLRPQSLQKYLYGKTKRPGRKVLVKAAEVFQCSLGELFLDQTNMDIPEGMEARDQSNFEDMLSRYNDQVFSAKDRQILYEDFISSVNRLKILKNEILKK